LNNSNPNLILQGYPAWYLYQHKIKTT